MVSASTTVVQFLVGLADGYYQFMATYIPGSPVANTAILFGILSFYPQLRGVDLETIVDNIRSVGVTVGAAVIGALLIIYKTVENPFEFIISRAAFAVIGLILAAAYLDKLEKKMDN